MQFFNLSGLSVILENYTVRNFLGFWTQNQAFQSLRAKFAILEVLELGSRAKTAKEMKQGGQSAIFENLQNGQQPWQPCDRPVRPKPATVNLGEGACRSWELSLAEIEPRGGRKRVSSRIFARNKPEI